MSDPLFFFLRVLRAANLKQTDHRRIRAKRTQFPLRNLPVYNAFNRSIKRGNSSGSACSC